MKQPNLFLLFSLTREILRTHLGTTLTVDTGRNNAPGIASTLATREKTTKADMLQGGRITKDTDGTAGTGLDSYQYRLVGQEPVSLTAEGLETFLQTVANHRRQPKVKWR